MRFTWVTNIAKSSQLARLSNTINRLRRVAVAALLNYVTLLNYVKLLNYVTLLNYVVASDYGSHQILL